MATDLTVSEVVELAKLYRLGQEDGGYTTVTLLDMADALPVLIRGWLEASASLDHRADCAWLDLAEDDGGLCPCNCGVDAARDILRVRELAEEPCREWDESVDYSPTEESCVRNAGDESGKCGPCWARGGADG